ncbi:MAG: histidine kinase dimerization/phosphoacceptor domain-containing protein [Micropruina sp.]
MRIPRGARTAAVMVVVLVVGVLGQIGTWMVRHPDLDLVPEADAGRVAALMLGEVFLGLLAVALLPLVIGARARPGRRAGVAALVITLASASALALPAAMVALGAVASWLRRGWLAAVGAAWLAVQVTVIAIDNGLWLGVVGALLVGGGVAMAGLAVGRRRALVASLRDRAVALEREQAAVVAGTRLAERTRIAREMHDTLSHRLSVISLHAGGLAVHPDGGPGRVEETARLIQQSAQTASEELHAVLTVLRDDQHDVRPDPTLDDLEAVIAVLGADVRLTVDPPLAGGSASSRRRRPER